MALLQIVSTPSGNSGMVEYNAVGLNEPWANLRGAATGSYATTASGERLVSLVSSSTTNQYQWMQRGFITFDTSVLGPSAIITSAVVSIYGAGKYNTGFLSNPDLVMAGGFISTPGTLVVGDYANVERTALGTIAYTDFVNGYMSYPSSAAIIAKINKTGLTTFSFQSNWDIADTPPTWLSTKYTGFFVNFSDVAGKEPTLDITYTGGFIPKILIM